MIRRAQPLLGTIVSISADAPMAAVDAAFAAVKKVHRLMSAQRSASDVGRINRDARRSWVPVHTWTFELLQRAAQISECSAGAFDVVTPGTGAQHTDVMLERGRVRLRRPARIDVSGIAKGFAVDMAVGVLRAHGARVGSVNAGGDLRFFGGWEGPVKVRAPANFGAAVCLPTTTHQAFATSSSYFGAKLNDPRAGTYAAIDWSVTVAAATCLTADALTKAVALLGPARSLLEAFDAAAFAVDSTGQLHAASA